MALIALWQNCLEQLQHELPAQQFNTWVRPLQAAEENGQLVLSAPNRFVCDWVKNKYLERMQEILADLNNGHFVYVELSVGEAAPMFKMPSVAATPAAAAATNTPPAADYSVSKTEIEPSKPSYRATQPAAKRKAQIEESLNSHKSYLNPNYTFDAFVEGKSNQLAVAAASQVATNEKNRHNPLFIYGGVGLGKTHLMHAVGHELLRKNPNAKVLYLHSERFVQDMAKALRLNAVPEFKRYYRNLDALLIDDIQFFAGKDTFQEEFFHTFNALLEGGKQLILTSDRYPKEIDKLDDRLKSRFGWGLAIAVEPPDLATRVAILQKKAEAMNRDLSSDAAFFIAQKIRSNVRELEGNLKRVVAAADFTGSPITVPLIKEALKDLIALQDRQVSIDNIQRVIADYYKIKMADILSKSRKRSFARPRQVAMALSKELTNHSLPEIGDAFGGRDHTTVLHACRKIKELQETSAEIQDDYKNLLRILTT